MVKQALNQVYVCEVLTDPVVLELELEQNWNIVPAPYEGNLN